jgi:hypothetical protein
MDQRLPDQRFHGKGREAVLEGRAILAWEALTRASGSERIYLDYNRAQFVAIM